MTSDGSIAPPAVTHLSGAEPIVGTSVTVRDFWAWAMSDLRSNTVRSTLAEFLVARALGADHRVRIEWDPYDVITSDGVRVEVKASAYLQAWAQRAASTIIFSGLHGRVWDPVTGYAETPTYNADVYVFAVVSGLTHDQYDALNTDRWQFWVMPKTALEARGTQSIGLRAVQALGEGVPYDRLADAVGRVALARTR